jgi:DNA-binding SARP family transcriptional activator
VRRARAYLVLLAIIVGPPMILLAVIGPPRIPSFAGSDGLSGSYVPPEAVLSLVAFVAWCLWAYMTFAILLSVLATFATVSGKRSQYALAAASRMLTPRTVRRLVEWAVGTVLLFTAASSHVQASGPLGSLTSLSPTDHVRQAVEAETAAIEAPEKAAYRIRVGDSLWRIGAHELGSGFRWRRIFELNRGRRFRDGRSLTNPHLIYPGWQLQLSRRDNGSADASENKPHANASPTATNSEMMPSIPSRKPPLIPTPENGGAQEPTRGDVSETHQAEQSEAERLRQPIIQLPSGLVVAASFASGILTAHLLGRLRERRSRRLLVPDADETRAPRLDVDLRRAGASPMPAHLDVALDTLAQVWVKGGRPWPRIVMIVESQRNVRVFLRDQNPALPSDAGGGVLPLVRFSRDENFVRADVSGPFPAVLRPPLTPMKRGLTVPLGRGPDDSAIHVAILTMGPISISGPKAVDLVRQMVVALAVQGSTDDLQIILLGIPADLQHIDRLPQVSGSYPWEEAAFPLREVQTELLRRARMFLEEGVDDIWAYLAKRPDDRLPALLFVVGDPPPVLRGLAEAVARQASSLGAVLLGVGWEPGGSRLSAEVRSDTDLRTNLPGSERVQPLLLGRGEAEEAIDIIERAHPAQDQGAELLTGAAPAEPVVSITRPKESLPVRMVDMPNDELAAGESLGKPGPPPGMVAVRCLGPLEVSRSGHPIRKGWRSKSLELLAFLVAHPEGASKERIVEELWPETNPLQGSELFYVATSTVRGKLRGRDDSGAYVDRQGEVFRLEEGKWWVDAWEFERLLEGSDRLDEAGQASGKLRDALSLYHGEFCSERYYPWAEAIRERFRALFVRACAQLADFLTAEGEHVNALAILERGIDADPICEDLTRKAMAIEAMLGRRAAALARYRKLEATLDTELNADPDPETQALVRQLATSSGASRSVPG